MCSLMLSVPHHTPSPSVTMNRTYPVHLFGSERTASVSIKSEYPPGDFIAPAPKTLSTLMDKVWAAVAKMTGPGERMELQEGAYIVWLRVTGMSVDTTVMAAEHRCTVQVEMQYMTGPRPPQLKLPAPKPWTPDRIAGVMAKARRKTELHDPGLWYLVSSRFRAPHITSFRTLGEAVEFGSHSFEHGDSYALCVVRNGALYYWHWCGLDDHGRDAHIERAIVAAAESGLPVTKVVRRIGK